MRMFSSGPASVSILRAKSANRMPEKIIIGSANLYFVMMHFLSPIIRFPSSDGFADDADVVRGKGFAAVLCRYGIVYVSPVESNLSRKIIVKI